MRWGFATWVHRRHDVERTNRASKCDRNSAPVPHWCRNTRGQLRAFAVVPCKIYSKITASYTPSSSIPSKCKRSLGMWAEHAIPRGHGTKNKPKNKNTRWPWGYRQIEGQVSFVFIQSHSLQGTCQTLSWFLALLYKSTTFAIVCQSSQKQTHWSPNSATLQALRGWQMLFYGMLGEGNRNHGKVSIVWNFDTILNINTRLLYSSRGWVGTSTSTSKVWTGFSDSVHADCPQAVAELVPKYLYSEDGFWK